MKLTPEGIHMPVVLADQVIKMPADAVDRALHEPLGLHAPGVKVMAVNSVHQLT